ncbi:MAG: CBS domain-containing protein [Verrucomicrobia bacterium]|nr:CBS domain-containing protein [Verrucomicrobiota bacterium]
MKIPMPVSAVLAQKGPMVVSIQSDVTVFDAITLMSEKNVGALPVLEKGRLVGMISERDYTRKIALKGKLSKETSVQEIMSRQVSVAKPDDSIEECMRLMTDKHVRHLPVMEGDKMLGIVSIGDLVKWIISVQAETIEQLQKYIAGSYPA